MDFFIILSILILIFLAIYFSIYFFYAFFYFILPMIFYGAFFAKIDDRSIENMINLANIKSGQKIVDLGSGDGRLVIALAKAGAIAYGFEINPFLVYTSKRKIKKAGLDKKAFIKQSNFWNEDLSGFDAITIFGIKFIMEDLEKKLKKELKPGAIVISKYFTFPNWKPIKNLEMINLYKK